MDTDLYSRAKIAEQANVSPQKVYRYLKDNNINPVKKISRTDYFSKEDAQSIIDFFRAENESIEANNVDSEKDKQGSEFDTYILLKNQIDDLNKELSKLHKRLESKEGEVSELHALLSQEQQLARTEQMKRIELENTNVQLIETRNADSDEKDRRIVELENQLAAEKNKGFFAKLFGK
ncbi:hypothetical protein O2U01_11075 (plasmid) [Ligilactobacillus salivarius]|uniref:DUF536 domain-containing protein n=1 Tax=Ligilactobacillus salivarius TaxID=1624 RepID=A0ABD7YYV4_9LACO|nr:hypothetical protein [Ligilactobacillus salivarius]WHS05258.1 hypothetical protein O2U07_01240 [Ligilactobacillus salivarius]WHS07182.1 hypothetical protein O2U05_00160 [Ligilactobacillus salivarius]WHS10999.1 hypothetical protein O2U04_10115 [Ligilactobacillus salivarius]WHS15275.1 hypothetical protein O2U03_10970 [Ligilactobacillus salivarius]WHS18821.1 hypothetical protein O2U02_11125 [Ligilactobacillus salivarius]